MKLKSSDLKRMARNALRGRWGSAVAIFILNMLLAMGVTMITSLFSSATSFFGILVYWVSSIIVSLLTSLFSAGTSYFFLNICRGREYRMNDLFTVFRMSPDRFLIVSLIVSSVSLLCTIPSYFWQPSTDQIYLYSAICSLLMLFGSVITMILSVFFGLSNYLLFDFPEIGAIDALRMSARLMKGNKKRYIYISLSFMGWIFLSMGTGFIALLWVEPYMMMTMTYFYADILDRYEKNIYNTPINTAPADVPPMNAASVDITPEDTFTTGELSRNPVNTTSNTGDDFYE